MAKGLPHIPGRCNSIWRLQIGNELFFLDRCLGGGARVHEGPFFDCYSFVWGGGGIIHAAGSSRTLKTGGWLRQPHTSCSISSIFWSRSICSRRWRWRSFASRARASAWASLSACGSRGGGGANGGSNGGWADHSQPQISNASRRIVVHRDACTENSQFCVRRFVKCEKKIWFTRCTKGGATYWIPHTCAHKNTTIGQTQTHTQHKNARTKTGPNKKIDTQTERERGEHAQAHMRKHAHSTHVHTQSDTHLPLLTLLLCLLLQLAHLRLQLVQPDLPLLYLSLLQLSLLRNLHEGCGRCTHGWEYALLLLFLEGSSFVCVG